MGATNHTANYNLSQFVGTDKPAWLQDYNGDMTKIDAGINAAKLAADSAALDAGAAQSDATAANNAITNTITPAISSLQNTVGTQGGAINTINSLIGNGTPTTTDQTIIGAINEINAEITLDINTRTQVYQSGGTNANYTIPDDDLYEIVVSTGGATAETSSIGVMLNGVYIMALSRQTQYHSIIGIFRLKAGSVITSDTEAAGTNTTIYKLS